MGHYVNDKLAEVLRCYLKGIKPGAVKQLLTVEKVSSGSFIMILNACMSLQIFFSGLQRETLQPGFKLIDLF